MDINNYIKLVNDKLTKAYAPYSNFNVACLIVTKTDELIYGVNVENSSYGATICAERNAFTTFVTEGFKKGDVKYIFITSNLDEVTPPCGICRQFMEEFVDEEVIFYLTNVNGEFKKYSISTLLPLRFSKKDLGV